MPIPLRLRRWLLLATLPCLAANCHNYCDGCPPPCVPQPQGGLSLRPASLAWLPTPAPDSLRLRNSNGFRVVLALVSAPAALDSVTLPALANNGATYREEDLNATYQPCGSYFRARRVYWHCRAQALNLDLQLNLLKSLNAPAASASAPLTRAAADTLADLVAVGFNGQYFAEFPVAAGRPYRQPRPTPLGGTTVYLDSAQLAGRTFFGVYQHTRPVYSVAVQPLRFYFQPGQGLVGFTYTNNEQWARY